MDVYERSREIAASADELFAFLRDPANLPKYVTPLDNAELVDDERVDMTGTTPEGGPMRGQGRLQVDEGARRLEWAARGRRDYSGHLEVTELGPDSSRLSVHLQFADLDELEVATEVPPPQERTPAMERSDADHDPVERALGAALETIRREVEGTGTPTPTHERPT